MGWKAGAARRRPITAELRDVLRVQVRLTVVLLLVHLLARLVGLPTSPWWMLVVAMAGALQITSDRCWEECRRRSTLVFALLVAPVVGVVPFLAVGALLDWDEDATDAALAPSTAVGLLLASHVLRTAHLLRLARRPGPGPDPAEGPAAAGTRAAAEAPEARRTLP
ncbi:hypothetical protein [Kitasatospora sp. NPDC059327]|uniref:hypothetical protein n=1 Tax=Kitasatospora sp. NPDC059327 TaxID=3346803 RepID=UPI00367F99EF